MNITGQVPTLNKTDKVVYLTFDDGPGVYTERNSRYFSQI